MRTLPASALKPGDHIRIVDREVVVSHVRASTPKAGMVEVTAGSRVFGFGASTRVQVVGLS